MEVGDKPRRALDEKQPRVIAVRAQEAGWDRDEGGRLHAGRVGALLESFAESLFSDEHSFLTGHADDFDWHAVKSQDEVEFFQHGAVSAIGGVGEQRGVFAAAEGEGAADTAIVAGHKEFVDGLVGHAFEGGGFDAAANGAQGGRAFREDVAHLLLKTEIRERNEGEQGAKGAGGLVKFVPERVGAGQESYFVGFPEDEVIVGIRSDADARRRRAEASERFQSSPVIVLKGAAVFFGGEPEALDEGRSSGEGVLHGSGVTAAITMQRGSLPATGTC